MDLFTACCTANPQQVETGLKALADVDRVALLRHAASMLILTVSGLNVLGPVLAQGLVSWLTG